MIQPRIHLSFKLSMIFILLIPFMMESCGDGDASSDFPREETPTYVSPTAQGYTEAEEDPHNRIFINDFSIDNFESHENLNEDYFTVSWDIFYHDKEILFYYIIELYLIDKPFTQDTDWDNGKYMGPGIKLFSKAMNSARNFSRYRYTYNYAQNTLMATDRDGEKPYSLDELGDHIYLLCSGYTRILDDNDSVINYRTHRIIELDLHHY